MGQNITKGYYGMDCMAACSAVIAHLSSQYYVTLCPLAFDPLTAALICELPSICANFS